MQVLIVHVHPEPDSFCAALTRSAVEVIGRSGSVAIVSDLYAEGFNPVAGRHDFVSVADPTRFHYQTEQLHAAREKAFCSEIAREQARVRDADAIILVFPLWWGGPPAILKGWIDRVLAYGFAYVDGARFESGLFRAKRGLLCVTTGGTRERFSEEGVYGPIEKVLWPVQTLAIEYMGLAVEAPFVCYGTPRVGDEGRARYLKDWRERVGALLAKGPIATNAATMPPPDADPAPWTRK
jgi:NAD(P)H dehydrogenase (quinone)